MTETAPRENPRAPSFTPSPPTPPPAAPAPQRLQTAARACAAGAAALGTAVLAAWALGVGPRSSLVPGLPPMVPDTALMLALAGLGLLLRVSEAATRAAVLVSRALAAGVLLLSAADLLADLADSPGLLNPRRPAPQTSAALLCLSLALLFFERRVVRNRRPAEGLALAAGSIALLAALGHLFKVSFLYLGREPNLEEGMAILTFICVEALSLGTLLARPRAGVMDIVTSRNSGGIAVRHMLGGLAAVAPLALLVSIGARRHWFDPALSAAFVTFCGLAAGAVSILTAGRRLERAAEARRRSEERARQLFDQASDGIFVADLRGRYVDVNAAAGRMLGYDRDELLRLSIRDLIRPEAGPRLERDREAFLRGESRVSEWEIRRKDGTFLPVEVSAKILPDGRWQAFVRDISERKKAEELLRLERERVDLALQGADLASWDWNIRTGEVVVNSRWAEMRGYRPDEVRPHVDEWLGGIHPDDLPRVRKILDEHLAGRRDYEAQFRVRTKAGGWIWILDRGRVFLRDERGEPLRMVGTELDITERERAAEESRRRVEQERFRLALDAAANAMAVVDRGGRVAFVNAACERLFAWSRGELTGRRVDVLIPEGLRPVEDAGRRPLPRDFVARRKDGREFPVEITLTRVEEYGEPLVVASISDIRARKEAEARLKRSVTELESFAYSVAHDLRSPLRALEGYARILAERLGERADAESRELLDRMAAAAVRLDRLIRDLLAYSAVSRGDVALEAVDLDSVVSHVIANYPELSATRPRVRSPLGRARAQPSLLLQSVSNLLDNAVKYVPPGRAPEIEVWSERRGDGWIRLAVQDNGAGIPREAWDRVFDPFVSLAQGADAGTGIGLAIAKRAVERMGGRVRLESEADRGSRFWIDLQEVPAC